VRRNTIYFVDEDPAARSSNVRTLRALLDNPQIRVLPLEPRKDFPEYNQYVADPTTAAFMLDQRMKGSGAVKYNGIDLAHYIRAIDAKVPIYILTGHVEDIEVASQYLVEYVVGKEEIDADSETKLTIKARLLRHLEVFNDVREAQEQRFHDLLIKSLSAPLSEEEQREMSQIEGETTAAIQAVERGKEQELGKHVEALRELLGSGRLSI
jgi:hypothetical protein